MKSPLIIIFGFSYFCSSIRLVILFFVDFIFCYLMLLGQYKFIRNKCLLEFLYLVNIFIHKILLECSGNSISNEFKFLCTESITLMPYKNLNL